MKSSGSVLSIILLTYNRKTYLETSLQDLLKQTVSPHIYEIIVIDDGSSDGTKEFVMDMMKLNKNIHYHWQKNQGIPTARNMGISLSSSPYVAIVADDYCIPNNYVATILQFFQDSSEAQIVRFPVGRSDSKWISRISHACFKTSMIYNLTVQNRMNSWQRFLFYFRKVQQVKTITSEHRLDASGGAAFNRKVFDQVGMFDTSLKRTEDTDFAWRLQEHRINIFFNPTLELKHRYPINFLKTVRKYYESGYYSWLLHKKYSEKRMPGFFGRTIHSTLFPIFAARQSPLKDMIPVFLVTTTYKIAHEIGYCIAYWRTK